MFEGGVRVLKWAGIIPDYIWGGGGSQTRPIHWRLFNDKIGSKIFRSSTYDSKTQWVGKF
jgi:hypothetical protein